MNTGSFFESFIIVSFLFFTKNHAIANLDNVNVREQNALANMVLNYLKVPWINVDSPWAQRVTSDCRNDVTKMYESASAGDTWALQMLDSSSKVPSGIMMGNIRDLGTYDECIRVTSNDNSANIQGRHCMVSLSMPSKFINNVDEILLIQKASIYNPTADVALSLTTSVCLPSSCGVGDVAGFVNASIQHTPGFVAFEVDVAQVTCSGLETEDDLVLGRIVVLSFFAVIAIILLLCTICEFFDKARPENESQVIKTAAKFSLYANTLKLLSTKVSDGTMPAIHGIRFVNTCLVMAGHRVVSVLAKPVVNLTGHYELRQTMGATFILMLPYVVDTFFVLTGFLIAYSFLRALQQRRKFNVLILYVHRYLRLTPCMGVLILVSIFILPKLGSGPMWESVIGVTTNLCRKNWWTNLLYVQNFVNTHEMCMLHTWYLAVEMQLFWICPIILYPLYYRPKLGLTFLGLLSLIALIAPPVQLVLNEWAAIFRPNKSPLESYFTFLNFYPVTYNRVLPYLIGILLGYDLVNNKRRPTKVQLVFNWTLSGLFVVFSAWSTYFIQPNAPVYDVVWEVMYVTVARLGWSCATAWVFYACTQGYGGFVTRFLSLPIFIPVSRMCYSMYLVHFVIQIASNAAARTAEHVSPFTVTYQLWGDLVMSIAAAFVLTLCFESPVIVLEKMLLSRERSRGNNLDSAEKKRKLSTIIKEHVNRTKGKDINCDSNVDLSELQHDFWQTISQVLDTSVEKKKTKTPEEWVEAWKDWRSNLLKNADDRTENGVKGVQIVSRQCQDQIPALENELLIFLAGVSSGLSEAANSDGSEICGESSKQDSLSWKNEEPVDQPSIRNSEKPKKFSGSASTGQESLHRRNGGLP